MITEKNMTGKNKGVQAHMLEISDCALYIPCGVHTWNLVISDAAKSSKCAVDFFGLIRTILSFRHLYIGIHFKNVCQFPINW